MKHISYEAIKEITSHTQQECKDATFNLKLVEGTLVKLDKLSFLIQNVKQESGETVIRLPGERRDALRLGTTMRYTYVAPNAHYTAGCLLTAEDLYNALYEDPDKAKYIIDSIEKVYAAQLERELRVDEPPYAYSDKIE